MMRKTPCLISFIILALMPLSVGQAGAVGTRGISVTALDKSSGEKKEVKLYNKSYAVIIGIDQYKNLKYDQQLSYAVRDAKGVEDVLRKNFKFDKIITLYNDNATKANIRKVLLGDLSKISKEDSVFVFWAGHGYTEKTDFGDLGYLLPFDGEFVKSKLYENISMSMIKDDISKRIPAKHIFFVMDACYGGLLVAKRGAERQTRRDFAYLREITKEQVRQVLTAGSKDQQVLDGGPKGHSVFTGRFIELLENTDDFITATEISTSVKEKVFSDAKARNHIQTPKYGELFGLGDYVFVPSIEQRVEDTKSKVVDLQKELERLNAMEKVAARAEDESAKRRAEQEKRAIQARLKTEQLRQQALEEDRKRREREEIERKAKEKKLVERKQAEEKRLAFLTEKVKEKRKEMSGITPSSVSPEATITEMWEEEARIEKIRADFRKELANSKKYIFDRIEKKLLKLDQEKKNEFETKQEFRRRIAKKRSEAEKEEVDAVIPLTRKIESEYEKQVSPFIQNLSKLSRNEFTLTGDELALEISKYNISSKTFTVVINAKRSIKGIVVVANADISIPRQEAKTFKRHFRNNILRSELSGHFDTLESFRVMRAYIIDDVTNKQYVLFPPRNKSKYDAERKYASLRDARRYGPYIVYDNGLLYDTSTGLEWLAGPDEDVNWFDTNGWISRLTYDGHGWRWPTIDELRILYQNGKGTGDVISLFNLSSGYVWSGDDDDDNMNSSWFFYFYDGTVHSGNRNSNEYGGFWNAGWRGANRRFAVRYRMTSSQEKNKMKTIKKNKNTLIQRFLQMFD